MSKNDFDRLFNRLDELTVGFGPTLRSFQFETNGYPPHNIESVSDNAFNIEIAVAGFKKSEIKVSELDRVLHVEGQKDEIKKDTSEYQYRGISFRNFKKSFRIAEYYEVSDISLEDGLLTISFVKNEPEKNIKEYTIK